MKPAYCRMAALTAVAMFFILVLGSCTTDVQGSYADQSGTWKLELKSGGKATMTFSGQSGECTYTSTDKRVSLNCPGTTGANFDIQKDGSLTGASDSMVPPLRKLK